MWLFSEDGFYSAVLQTTGEHKGEISIRARVREDLERLLAKHGALAPDASAISERRTSDYRYRVWMQPEQWAAVAGAVAGSVDYSNFKSHVGTQLGAKREGPLHRIWSILGDLQPGGPYGWWAKRRAGEPREFGRFDDLPDEELGGLLSDAFGPTETEAEPLTEVRPYLRDGKTVSGYKQKRRKRRRKGKR